MKKPLPNQNNKMKKQYLTLAAITLITANAQNLSAQTISQRVLSMSPMTETETPPTTKQRVENAKQRHTEAVSTLVTDLKRIPLEPQLIGTKEMLDKVDEGDRAIKRTVIVCDAIRASLKSEIKTINGEKSFSKEQKEQLFAAVDAMDVECKELSEQAAATSKELEKVYAEMKKWRKVYKTFLNLDSQEKANESLKTEVDAYVQALTAKPESKPAPDATASPDQEAKEPTIP